MIFMLEVLQELEMVEMKGRVLPCGIINKFVKGIVKRKNREDFYPDDSYQYCKYWFIFQYKEQINTDAKSFV